MIFSNRTAKAKDSKQKFISKWSLEKIENLTLDEYVSSGKKSGFCYDIEHNTPGIGSIRGGSSEKFGIYRKNNPCNLYNFKENDKYAWHKELGDNVDTAFKNLKQELVTIIKAAIDNVDLNIISDAVDIAKYVWPSFKWKIVFLYGKEGLIPDIFSVSHLRSLSGEKSSLEAYKKLMEEYKKSSDADIYIFFQKKGGQKTTKTNLMKSS